jgi:hypothetical protein
MAEKTRFERTLTAVKRTDATQGDIGRALRADIHATGGAAMGHADRAVDNFEECALFLQARGYTYSQEYLRSLYRLASIKPRLRDVIIE